MKIIICLNNDFHALTALNFLFADLKKHQVKIVLSQGVGKSDGLAEELRELSKVEQEGFTIIDSLVDKKNKFLTFQQITESFQSEIVSYENINSEIALEDFKEFAPDLIISIRFGQIFRNTIINILKHGIINLHSGILPNYRGVMPSFWAILSGESRIGTTLHYISDATIDTGAILGFSYLEVDKNRSLFFNINQLYEGGCDLIIDHLEKISAGLEIKILRDKNVREGQYFSYPKSLEVQRFLKIMPLVEKEDVFNLA